MLYQPSFPSPYLSTIDANKDNTFRFKVGGDFISAYQIFIYNASTNELVYESEKIELEEGDYVYGNDGDDSFIEVTIPAYIKKCKETLKADGQGIHITGDTPDEDSIEVFIGNNKIDSISFNDGVISGVKGYEILSGYTYDVFYTITSQMVTNKMTNGNDYVWKVKLWQPNYDIEVVKGRVYTGVYSGSNIKIRPHTENTVQEGMSIKIANQNHMIKSCELQYPKVYTNQTTSSTIGVLRQVKNIDEFKVGDYVVVGNFDNIKGNYDTGNFKITDIDSLNSEIYFDSGFWTWQTALKDDGSNIADATYVQKNSPSLYSTIEVETTFSEEGDQIPIGTEYTILSNFVESDVGFFFKARSEPQLKLFNYGVEIFDTGLYPGLNISNSTINITGAYSQKEGSNIKYWRADILSEGQNVFSTHDVYNNKIEFSYDGLLPKTYALKILVVSSDDVELEKNLSINVDYTIADSLFQPKVTQAFDSAIKIDWSEMKSIIGESNITDFQSVYIDGNLTLTDDQFVQWNHLDLSEPTTVSLLTTNLTNYKGSIVEIFDSETPSNIIKIGYDTRNFWWEVNGEKYSYSPYNDEISFFDSATIGNDENSENTLYLWDNTESNLWKTGNTEYWKYNDYGTQYWWLIQINLYESEIAKMVTFTKYKKE